MISEEIRQKFLKFFEERGHQIIQSASLVPENDPSVLFTTAGMQQFKSYYIGEKDSELDFGSKNVASAQKCVRTSDIDEVGDNTHLTFFEMLGNFSFGKYWKKEAISWAHKFITQELGLAISYVTIFCGTNSVPKDKESKEIWQSLGIMDIREEGMNEVFWGPTGQTGPCGPTTEIYCRNVSEQEVEIWNIVFNEFKCDGSREELLAGRAKLIPLVVKGIDTGMGLERLLVIVNQKTSVFETDLFAPIISEVRQQSAQSNEKGERIVADHVRTAVFMITDGVTPSNTDRGYVLRRVIRRAVRYADQMQADTDIIRKVAKVVIEKYKTAYPALDQNREKIFAELNKEEEKFRKTLQKGLSYAKNIGFFEFDQENSFGQIIKHGDPRAEDLFILYTTYGFPPELAIEELENILTEKQNLLISTKNMEKPYWNLEKKQKLIEGFNRLMNQHKKTSRTGADQKFKGGLASTGEMEIKYHTATHLLLASLRQVLGQDITQKGSNITSERLRFDFNWPEKLSPEQIKAVEDLVNQKIAEKIPVEILELPKEEAKKLVTVLSFDESKYGDTVKVYKINDPSKPAGQAFSTEFCGGPHVTNTGDLASTSPLDEARDKSAQVAKFKITKEEAISAGVRRIKAVLG